MKILIEISEEDYLGIKDPDRLTAYWANIRAKEAIRKGTPIPDNATNGDMIKAMFPNAKIKHGVYGINGTPLICLSMGTRYDVHEMSFVEDFWNALYKRGE